MEVVFGVFNTKTVHITICTADAVYHGTCVKSVVSIRRQNGRVCDMIRCDCRRAVSRLCASFVSSHSFVRGGQTANSLPMRTEYDESIQGQHTC